MAGCALLLGELMLLPLQIQLDLSVTGLMNSQYLKLKHLYCFLTASCVPVRNDSKVSQKGFPTTNTSGGSVA